MSVPNEQVVDSAKAVIDTANTLASQGKLAPKQADKFIDFVVDLMQLQGNVRVIRFTNEEMYIDKLGVGRRVAMPAVEGKDPGLRRGVVTSRVTLKPVEIMVAVEMTDTVREINMEGASFEDHVLKIITTQLGNDSEELQWAGDTVGVAAVESDIVPGGGSGYIKDSYLALLDGVLRLADTNTHLVDLSGLQVGSTAFSKLINAMPAKFKRSRRDLRFMCSIDTEQNFREKIGGRATALGDAALQGDTPMKSYGIPVMSFPLFPHRPRIVQHVTLNGTTAVSLRYKAIENVVVTRYTLDAAPESAYVLDTDYSLNTTTGTITRIGSAGISDGQVVKVSYDALPQIILTHMKNIVVGIGRDIRIEKDRDIFKRANQYAITFKMCIALEEPDAVVKGINLSVG